MDLPCYHGNIGIKTCEKLLLRKAKNGCYLLRNSESVPEALCLCILVDRFKKVEMSTSKFYSTNLLIQSCTARYGRLIYTYRIFQNVNGLYLIQAAEGVKEKTFTNLRNLISNYEKPNQGLVYNLIYPVNKDLSEQMPLQMKGSLKRVVLDETYAEIDDREYVAVLPS